MPSPGTRATARPATFQESAVLDVVFIAATIAILALVGWIARGVEKL